MLSVKLNTCFGTVKIFNDDLEIDLKKTEHFSTTKTAQHTSNN